MSQADLYTVAKPRFPAALLALSLELGWLNETSAHSIAAEIHNLPYQCKLVSATTSINRLSGKLSL